MPASLPFYLLLTVVSVLAAGLTLAAWRRPNRRWRLGRVLAGLGAVAGLWWLAYPPSRTRPVSQPVQEAVLLTPGYQPDTLRQLLARLAPGTPVWRYGTLSATSADTPALSNLPALRQAVPQVRRLHVLGPGLPAADVPLLPPAVQLLPHQPRAYSGFRTAAWARHPELGQSWFVEGFFTTAQPKSKPVWISLHAGGAARDSMHLAAGSGRFRVRYTPKTTGRDVYTLVARQAGRRLAAEPVPLEVQPTRALRVLLLAAAPSFEFRFLKNHLAARQHRVAARTGLSRGLTQTEFLNYPAPPTVLDRLTPALLRRFDVLLTDAGALAGLSATEAAGVRQAVRGGGLGLLLLPDAAAPLPTQLPGRAAYRLQPRPAAIASAPLLLSWPDAPARLTALVPATLVPSPALRPVVLAAQQPVAATQRLGLGQVLVSTATETYTWLLQNNAAAYDAYWSRLLTAVAPPQPATLPLLDLLQPWPRPHAPVHLRLTGAPPSPLSLRPPAGSPVRLALRQDEVVPEWSTATFWPDAAGWHEARLPGGSRWFYVFGPNDWQGPEQHERQQAAASWQPHPAPAAPAAEAIAPVTAQARWPRWVGFLVFLLLAGFLWLEEKL